MKPRHQDWPLRLDVFIGSRLHRPFTRGRQDCCQFARQAVKVQTGHDPAKGWGLRPYKTARGALGQLARLGGLESLPERAGMAPVRVLLARRGDLVLVPNADRPALGVVLGAKVVYPGKDGLIFTALNACTAAWRVGGQG